jgi:diacylglycerol kinase
MKPLFKAFGFAFKGVIAGFASERNMKLHALAAVLVIAAGFYYHISLQEWVALMICIGGVVVTELINTAVEKLTDLISPEYNTEAGLVKDLAAGAVLMAAIISVVVGVIIFVPKIV